MKCPNCGSDDTTVVHRFERKNYDRSTVLMHYMCLGPLGSLFTRWNDAHSKYIACNSCGSRSKLDE